MTARGVEFLELWTERNVLPRCGDRTLAARLAQKLEFDAEVHADVEGYIRNIIIYLGGPGTPGD